jgi:hypothetical protein
MKTDPFHGRYRPVQQRDLVYSRRIGGRPIIYPTARQRDIIDNPSSVDLINALKVSGRTKDGLGVGILNAVTKRHLLQLKTETHKKQGEKKWSPCQIITYLF